MAAAVLILLGLVSDGGALPPPQGRDGALHRAVVERVRGGESYYEVTGTELRDRGYPTLPPFTWRLPTLAVFQALLPGPRAGTLILTVLGVTTIFLWCLRFGSTPVVIAGSLSLLTMLPAWMDPQINAFHELWAGQLIALSLAARASGWRGVSLVAAALALGIREHALLYVTIMGGAAFLEGRVREAVAWSLAAAAFGVGLAVHYWLVLAALPPDPVGSSWMGWGGWSLVLATARSNFVLFGVSGRTLALVVPMLWAGLVLLRTPVQGRLAATVTGYFLVFAVVARPDNWYWGLLVAPLLPLGVAGLVQSLSGIRPGSVRARPPGDQPAGAP